MIGCLGTCVRKQPIIVLYFKFEDELEFYNLKARFPVQKELTLVLLKQDLSFFKNTLDTDQMASGEAIWSGSTMFSTLLENTCLQVEFYRLPR